MSDSTKKRWRTLKKNRNFDSNREMKEVENEKTLSKPSNNNDDASSSKHKTERYECAKCNLVNNHFSFVFFFQ